MHLVHSRILAYHYKLLFVWDVAESEYLSLGATPRYIVGARKQSSWQHFTTATSARAAAIAHRCVSNAASAARAGAL